LKARDPRAIGRAISLVENGDESAEAILSALDENLVSEAVIIGITGPPGAGKSTLTNSIISGLRQSGKRIGIIAIDPSSPISGGAILGDRIRMMQHATDHDVVMRSMATRGRLGGLCATAGAAVRIMASSGCSFIIIETVGVGQSEMDIIRLADITLLVLAPGLGDDIQAMKAGLLEVADILVVNKADCKGADILAMDLEAVTRKGSSTPTQVSMTVATESKGIAELLDRIDKLDSEHRDTGERKIRRRAAHEQEVLDWCLEMLRPKLQAEITKRELPLLGDPRLKAKKILEEQ
jgi:LAO/AO transport system kinase